MLRHTSALLMILKWVLRTAHYGELCTAKDGVRIEIGHSGAVVAAKRFVLLGTRSEKIEVMLIRSTIV